MLVAAIGVAGCPAVQSVPVPQASSKSTITAKDDAAAKRLRLSKIVVDLKSGDAIGSVAAGILCVPNRQRYYEGEKALADHKTLAETFASEMRSANFQVVEEGDENLFETNVRDDADVLVGGIVSTVKANTCHPLLLVNGSTDGTGEAYIKVEWQLYSKIDRAVIYELSTDGHSKLTESQAQPTKSLLVQAFAHATRNLIADPNFHAALAAGDAATLVAVPKNRAWSISGPGLSNRPVADHFEDIRRAVVTIFAGESHGSGFYVDPRGLLLTNQHILGSHSRVKVRQSGGREVEGKVIAVDLRRDVALIKTEPISATGLPLSFGRPSPGTDVYAVGSPLDQDLQTTITRGIISGYRTLKTLDYIQSDVGVLPGNSGGPLLDANGNAIGLASLAVFVQGAPAGINFFIPVEDALKALNVTLSREGG